MFVSFLCNHKSRELEIGCATRLFTKELAQIDVTIMDIDISDTLIMNAQKRARFLVDFFVKAVDFMHPQTPE